MAEPHLAQDVVVLVESRRVDAERDPAAAPDRLGDGRDAAGEMQVGARVGGDDRAGRGDRVEIFAPRPDAMGERQTRREQPERLQALDRALGIDAVGESALIARLEQVHVHSPARFARAFGDRGEHFVRAPLRAVRPELDGKRGALDRRRDRLDPGDLILDARRRREELRLDHGARGLGQPVQYAVGGAVDQRIAVAHEDRERDADADLRRRPRHLARFLDRRHRALEPGVMRHHRPGPAAGRPPERGERAEIGVDRRHRRAAQEPGLEGLRRRAEGRRRERPCVIMRIDERRHREQPARRRACRRRDRRDAAVSKRDVDRRPGRRARRSATE